MPFNFNQTNFEHTFQAKVTFLSNTFFGGEGIDISKNTKLDVNGTANFFNKSVFADVDVKNLNITSGANITGLTTFNNIDIDGELRDGDGNFGSAGQVLSSDGTDTKWVNAGSLAAGVAAEVSVSDDGDSDASRFVTFVDSASGSNAIKTDASIKYNPSSNQLSAGSFSGSIDASNVDSGTLGADRIPNLDAGKITTGTLGADRIPNLDAGKITTGTLGSDRIPNLDAGKITTGTLGADRIPNLDAGKITTGTLGTDRIPSLNASKINAGTLADARIPDLSGGKITSGTVAAARIDNLNASKINAGTLADARIPNLSGGKITSGTVAVERLGSGTPSSSNFLRGDGSWQPVAAFVTGMILLWSGAADAVPSGWSLCDGQDGRPDLRNRFVVGASSGTGDTTYPGLSVNATGGSADATLVSHSHTVDSHTHGDGSLTTANKSLTGNILGISEEFGQGGGSASGVFSKVGHNSGRTAYGSNNGSTGGVNFNGSHTHDVTGSTGSASPGTNSQGSSATNANLPPYYALCYIIKD